MTLSTAIKNAIEDITRKGKDKQVGKFYFDNHGVYVPEGAGIVTEPEIEQSIEGLYKNKAPIGIIYNKTTGQSFPLAIVVKEPRPHVIFPPFYVLAEEGMDSGFVSIFTTQCNFLLDFRVEGGVVFSKGLERLSVDDEMLYIEKQPIARISDLQIATKLH